MRSKRASAHRWLVLLLACATGCATVRVEYPAGHAQPRLITVQLYDATAHGRHGDVHRYAEALAIEAGCTKAALAAGQPMSVYRVSVTLEIANSVVYLSDSIDARRVSVRTGADAVVTGRAQLTPRSHRVEELTLEAHAPDGAVLARAKLTDDDGAEPYDAGERACRALFEGWGARRATAAKPPVPRSLLLFGEHTSAIGRGFADGCVRAAARAGATLLPGSEIPSGPGTVWQRLSAMNGATAFLVPAVSHPRDEPDRVSASVVWLVDGNGVVQDAAWSISPWARDPAAVGEELCRGLLAPR